MDRRKFQDEHPGQLVQITSPRKDWAFLPDPLPPKWDFDNALWPLIAEAKEALGTLNGIGQTLPDPQLLLRPLQAREAISSSSIEGTFVTPQELLAYELEPLEATSSTEKRADWQEVHNYRRALETGCSMLQEVGFSNHLIRSMHAILMRGVRGVDKFPGEFRRNQVQIGSSGRFIPAPPEQVSGLMEQLIQFTTDDDGEVDPLIKCFMIHYQFETIHPFADGNGRVGRALMAIMIYRWHRHAHPWLYLSAFFEKYKEEYTDNLFAVSTSGNWTQWLTYCLHATIAQANDSILRCTMFRELKDEFHARITKPSARTHPFIESLFKNPLVTIPKVAQQFDVAYHTAKREIERLVEASILEEIKFTHPQLYRASEIMRIAYAEDLLKMP